jgi:hypothetical protein
VTGKVRLSEQIQSGHAARLRELMPHRFADHPQAKSGYNLFAETANRTNIAKEFRRAVLRVHQPLCANIHDCSEVPLEFTAEPTKEESRS